METENDRSVYIVMTKTPDNNLNNHVLCANHFLNSSLLHRSDSNQATDYIANDPFLNMRVSSTKIENLK